ncbi:MAG: hypothetical protein WBA70_09325 [Thermodesulfobacteriota bacterium]
MIPLMLGMPTIIGPALPRSPYFIGPPMSELSVTKTGDGDGTVTSTNPAGLDCGDTCDIAVPDGMQVTLTATADGSSLFNGWGMDCSGAGTSTMITVSADSECTAEFIAQQFNVDVDINPPGGGSVTSSPAGITCPGDCNEEYIIQTMVNLNETTDPDSDFLGWTGPADCTDGIIQDLAEDITCTATFNLKRFTLDITKSGEGAGIVTSVPSGIDCGADCDEVFIVNTQVTLNAVADPVSIFTGFSGDPDCEDGVIDMTSDITCNANFDFLPLLLSPIFPALKNNVNSMASGNSTPGGRVAFVWGFRTGSFTVGGGVCSGIELGINPFKILGIVNVDSSGVADLIFFIPSLGDISLAFTQAVDLRTCRTSEVVRNILQSK